MKFGKLFLGSLASLALLAGCNNKENTPEVAPSMTLDPETLSFENVLSEQRIKITSNVDWTVSDIPSWITVKPTSGTASEEPVFVSVEVGTNGERAERSATLKFASEKISKTLKVTQKSANASFDLSEKAFAAKPEAGSVKFEVRSNVAWTVASDSKDFTVTPESGNGTAEVTVNYTANNNGAPRMATITVSTTEDVTPNKYEVKITQEGVQPQFDVSVKELAAAVEGGEVKFNVTANVDWKVSSSNEAFKVSPAEGHGDAEITVTYPANETPEPVSAVITVTAQNTSVYMSKEVKINQPAGGGAKVDVLTPASLGIPNGGAFIDVKADGFSASYSGDLKIANGGFRFLKNEVFTKFGVFSSKSGGKVKKVSVTWNSEQKLSGPAELLVFCSNDSFSAVGDFHQKTLQPTGKVSTEQTVFEVQGDYEYIAIRSDSNSSNFVDKIEITWE